MAAYNPAQAPKRVDSARATAWLGEGWRLFRKAPGVWIAVSVVLIVIHLLFGLLSAVGQIASTLLMPLFAAGLMECSRIAVAGDTPEIQQMFAGFRARAGNLAMVGLLILAALFVIGALAFAIVFAGGGAAAISSIKDIAEAGVDSGVATSGASIGLAVGSLLFAALVVLVLLLPLTMAMWFAPALVFFDDLAPMTAMKSSYVACMHNWLALSIYSIVLFVLFIIAAIPFGLGFPVLIPLAAISIYISYREIFHAE